MSSVVHLKQFLKIEVGIYLCGGYRRMAEEGLYRSDIGAISEQVSGKRVAQSMGRDFFDYAG